MKTSKAEIPKTHSEVETPEQNKTEKEKPSSGKPWLFWALVVLLGIGGTTAVWKMLPSNNPSKPATVAQKQVTPPRPVETVAIETGNADRKIQLLGQVEASQEYTVRARLGGIVEEILVQPGDRVKEGMTIASLDGSDQDLALSEAQAKLAQQRSNLARLEVGTRPEIITQKEAAVNSAKAREQEAKDNLERTTELVKEGALSERALVEAKAAIDVARGNLLAAEATLSESKAGPIKEEIDAQKASMAAAQATVNQAQLARQRTKIVAPLTGVVQTRHVANGDFVQPAAEIITLVAGDRFDIFLELPEELSGQIKPQMEIELRARALPQWKQKTTITTVVPSANRTSRRQLVRVQINNPPPGLLPGMAIGGSLSLPTKGTSYIVSRDALTLRQDQWIVFTVVDGKVKQIPVEMLADLGQKVAIYHPDLRAGQRLISRGGDTLQNGASVKVVDR